MKLMKLLHTRMLVLLLLFIAVSLIVIVAVKDSYRESNQAQYPWGNTVNEYLSENDCWTGVKRLSDAGSYKRNRLDCIEYKVKSGNIVWLLIEK